MGSNNSTPPPAPATPNLGQSSRDAIYADLDTLPARNTANINSQLEAINKLGPANTAYQIQSADQYSQAGLDMLNKYGPQYASEQLKLQEQLDPRAFQVRQQLGDRVSSDLMLGGQLDPDSERVLQEQVRGAQAARGNILGGSAGGQEAYVKQQLSQGLRQQRMGNAQSFLGLTPVTQQGGNVINPTAAASAVPSYATPTGVGPNPNAMGIGANFASSNYGTQMSGYNAGLGYSANMASQPNPWMQGLGLVAGIGSSALTSRYI